MNKQYIHYVSFKIYTFQGKGSRKTSPEFLPVGRLSGKSAYIFFFQWLIIASKYNFWGWHSWDIHTAKPVCALSSLVPHMISLCCWQNLALVPEPWPIRLGRRARQLLIFKVKRGAQIRSPNLWQGSFFFLCF